MSGARSATLAMLGLALAAGGCNTYKYFDIDVSFDPTSFNSNDVATISTCRITVSGADSATSDLSHCPPHDIAAPFEVGQFEFSTFKDSGTMTFTVDTFTGRGETDACKNGSGTVAIPVTGMTTITGQLKIAETGPGCLSTTPPTDGSM